MSNTITKAKAVLILDQPFFASLLLSMPLIEDTATKTLETNGEEIRYNPEFMATLSLQETVFVLAHETLHCVFEHMHTRGTRDASNWNIAADYVINELLVNDRVGTMPKGGLLDSDLVKRGNGTTTGVYGLLPSPQPQPKPQQGQGQQQGPGQPQPGPGQPGGPLDNVVDAPGDAATKAASQADTKVKVIQAANAAKMAGKLSAGVERLVKEVTKPKADWRAILRRFLTERAKVSLSYAKPKRRFLADDICLPSLTGEKLGGIAVGIDCSGSVNESLLALFSAEIKAIIEDTKPGAVHVFYFDTKVLKQETYTPDDSVNITPIGGGGTMFSPVFRAIEEQALDISACVMLTDLYSYDFGNVPSFPVLWASVGSDKAPFGDVVTISEEK